MSHRKVVLATAILTFGLGACSGNTASTCPAAQTLAISGYTTGSMPASDGLPTSSGAFPSDATYIYFSAGNQPTGNGERGTPRSVTGVPILKGSDGSTIAAGQLQAIDVGEIVGVFLFGYSASVAGLVPGVTYTASFAALTGVPGGCRYGPQASGSFVTGA